MTTAARAITIYNRNHDCAPQVVTDTAANIATYLNGLQTLYAAGKLVSITISGTQTLTITGAQYLADAGALSKITGTTYTLIVNAAAVSGAASLQANPRVSSFTVTDSSANVAANLDALNADTKLKTVTLSDSTPLSITYQQLISDTSILAKLPSGYTLKVSGVPAANAATVQANTHVTGFTVTDSSANVAARLDALNSNTKLTGVVLTDSNPLSITQAQLTADVNILAKLPSNYTLAVSGVTAANAATIQANTHVAAFTVTDSSINVAARLDALNSDTKLTAVILTDTASLTITQTQLLNDTSVLGKLSTNYTVSVTGVTGAGAGAVQSNSHVTTFKVADGSANVAANFDTLNASSKMSSVALMDSGSLAISNTQLTNGTSLLGKLPNTYTLNVSAVSAAGAAAVQANSHVVTFKVSDGSVGVANALDALNGQNKLSSIALTDGNPLAITYTQLITDTTALGKLPSNYTLTVSGVPASAETSVQSNTHVTGYTLINNPPPPTASALQTTLQAAMNGGYVAHLTEKTYTIDSTIIINITSNAQAAAGFDAGGAKFISNITNGTPVIQFNVAAGVDLRYLNISNLSIYGNLSEGAGIKIVADGADRSVRDFVISNVNIEHAGGTGLEIVGNVYDGVIANSWMHGNGAGGARISNGTNGGTAHDIKWDGGGFRKNEIAGLILDQGTRGITVSDAYLVENYGPGISAPGGITSVMSSGFENNQGAGIVFGNSGSFSNNSFSGWGPQAVGISGTLNGGTASLIGNTNEYYGPGIDTTKLANLQGTGSAVILGAGNVVTGSSISLNGTPTAVITQGYMPVTFPTEKPISHTTATTAGTSTFGQTLAAAVAGNYVAHLTEKTYTVSSPIVININSTMQGAMGIDGGGAKIISNITDGSPVIQINVGPGVDLRYLTLTNFTIEGNGKEGDGIRIIADGNDRWIYNWNISNVNVNHVGGIGLDMEGSVFEGTISNSWMNDNAGGGARFAHSDGGGVASAIKWDGGGFQNNAVAGMLLDGGARDVSVTNAAFVGNQGPGISAPGGITAVIGSSFENNQGAGVSFQNYGNFVDNTFTTSGSQTIGISGWLAGQATLTGNKSTYTGSGADPTKLANLQGNGAAAVIGGGNVVVGSGVATNSGVTANVTRGYMAVGFPTEHAASQTTGTNAGSSTLGGILQAAVNGDYVAHLTEKVYTVDQPIVINITSTMQGAVGIDGGGARIFSNITDGSPVIQINVGPGVDLRYLTLSNFTIQGNGHEGDGIKIVADGNDRWVYNFNMTNTNVEHVGGIGLNVEGSVFEGTITNSWMHDNLGGGARFAHSANGGIASAIKWQGGGFRKNGVGGLLLDNGMRDISVSNAYFVENHGPGISAPGGITSVISSGFENNTGAGIVFQNYGNFTDNSFSGWGPQAVGISGWMAGDVTMVGNTNEYYGSGADTTHLANLQGNGTATIIGGGNVLAGSGVVVKGTPTTNFAQTTQTASLSASITDQGTTTTTATTTTKIAAAPLVQDDTSGSSDTSGAHGAGGREHWWTKIGLTAEDLGGAENRLAFIHGKSAIAHELRDATSLEEVKSIVAALANSPDLKPLDFPVSAIAERVLKRLEAALPDVDKSKGIGAPAFDDQSNTLQSVLRPNS